MLFDAFASDRTVAWDEKITLRHGSDIDNDGFRVVTWRGARWTLLVRRVSTTPYVDVFLRIENPDDIPADWSCPVYFTFTLLTPSGQRSKYARDTDYEFRKDLFESEGTDRGFNCAFSLEAIRECAHPPSRSDDTAASNTDAPQRPSPTSEENSIVEVVEPGSTDEALVFVLRCELDGLMHDQSSPADCRRLTGMVGIENLGATCYLNALLQMLFHINAFRRVVYSLPHESSPGKTSVILALQSLFNHLQTSPTAATTQTLTRSFGWNSADAFQQQDVQEMMRVLIDKLEEYAKGSALEPALKNLFSGVLRSYIRCINIDYVSQRDEEFYDIQLDVKGFADVYASFDSYVAKELLNGDNKYDAGDERGKQDAEKGVVFRKFPPVLTIHLKRFAFDVERMCFAKIHDNFEFPTVLDLNRYLSLDDSDDQANKDANIYRLHSVLVHSGEVYGGHYYAYIRAMREESFGGSSSWIDEAPDMLPGETETSPAYQARLIEWRDRRGLWYKFDDDHVTCVTERTAVQRCYGRDAGSLGSSSVSSAYMLVYIRERDAAEIMRPLSSVDIPESLRRHLQLEERRARFSNMMVAVHEERVNVRFVTTEDMKSLSEYNVAVDFVDVEHRARVVSVSKKSTNLRLLLAVAQELQLAPDGIRLWIMRRRNKRTLYRPSSLISISSMMEPISTALCSFEVLYVEVLEPWQMSPNRHDIESLFLSLQHNEREWKESVLAELKKDFEITSDQEDEVIDSLGIGSPNYALLLLSEEAQDPCMSDIKQLGEEYLNTFETHPYILRSVPHFLDDSGTQSDEDTVAEHESKDLDAEGKEEEDAWAVVTSKAAPLAAAVYTTHPGGLIGARGLAGGNNDPQSPSVTINLLIIKLFDPRRISSEVSCPISFCTTRILKSDDSMVSLLHVLRDALAEAASVGVIDASEWNAIDVYTSAHSRNMVKLGRSEFSKRKLLSDFSIHCGEVIYIQSRDRPTPAVLGLDDYFVDVVTWLTYECDRMTIELRPATAMDVEIVMHRRGVWKYVPESYAELLSTPSVFSRDENSRNIVFPQMETSISATGLQLLSAMARRLGLPSYSCLAVTPSDVLRFDYLKDFCFIDSSELQAPLSSIMRSRNLTQTVKTFYFSIMPFDSIVFGPHFTQALKPSRSNCIDISGDDDSVDHSVISPLRPGAISVPLEENFMRYVEVHVSDARAKELRMQFIVDSIISPAMVGADDGLASPTKRLKTETGSTPGRELKPRSGSVVGDVQFRHPHYMDDVNMGFIESNKVFVRIECTPHKTSMSDIASAVLKNFSSPKMLSFFAQRQSTLGGDKGVLSLRDILTKVGVELEEFQDYSGYSEVVELRRRESNRAVLGGRLISPPVPHILDFFTSSAPPVFDVLLPSSGLSEEERQRQLDSKEPLVLLYTAKKKIRSLLQQRAPVQEFGILPRSMMDFYAEGRDGKSAAPLNSLNVCMQLVTREDELWMRGLMPKLKSSAVAVYLIALNQSTNAVTAISGPITPFISYITELDSYDAIVHRLKVIIGEDDPISQSLSSRKLPLCLVKDDHYQLLSKEPGDGGAEEAEDADDSTSSVWAAFEAMFPDRVFDNYSQYRIMNGSDAIQIPELCILLRSSMPSGSNLGHTDDIRKRKSSVGIKIN